MKWQSLVPLVTISMMSWTGQSLAHGSKIQYRKTTAIQIQATYDSGEPMANAQVVVYGPNNPSTPWIRGITDEKGYFTFTPDFDQTGNWDVKVRSSGHGTIISIPLGAETEASFSSPRTGGEPLQKLVMAGSVVWGFVGTGLFFARKKKGE